MENDYINKASETGLVKTAGLSIAFLTIGLMPSSNHIIPQQIQVNYGDYSQISNQSFETEVHKINETQQAEMLFSFANNLAENTKDLDKDIAQIISDDFWEMYD